jgi:hypothetical protein
MDDAALWPDRRMQMLLSNVRLLAPSDQINDLHVVVLADDDKIRAIAHVEAIDEYFGFDVRTSTQLQRMSIVERNLATIAKIITSKYDAHYFTEYTESGSDHGNNNKLIIIPFQDLSGIRLS